MPAAPATPQASTSSPATSPTSSTSTQSPSTPTPPATSQPSATPTYKVIAIPLLANGDDATAAGVNDSGIVVGTETPADSGNVVDSRAWMYSESAGSLTELTFEPSERGAVATAISNSGVIAGYEWTALGSQGCGGVFAPGFWTVQGGAQLLTGELTCYTMPAGVNDTGIIVGTYSNSGFPGYVAVAWSGANEATETGLPPLECDHCNRITVRATAVNDAGVIVGSSSYFSSCSYNEGGCPAPYPDGYYAVEWVNDSPINLGGQHDSHANAINNGTPALIVGQAGGDAAVWTAPGKVTDLGTLPGDNESEADAVNDVGEIVGQSMVVTANQDNVARAFLYVNGKMYDLNSLIDPTTPLPASTTLSSAVGINSQGWIAADATVTSTGPYGQNGATVTETTAAPHAYLLIPND